MIIPYLDSDSFDYNDDINLLLSESDIYISSDKELLNLAFDNNVLVGASWFSVNNETYDFDIIVKKDYQGKGFGSELLQSVLDNFNELKDVYPDSEIDVYVVNPIMQSMLEKQDFKINHQIDSERCMMSPSNSLDFLNEKMNAKYEYNCLLEDSYPLDRINQFNHYKNKECQIIDIETMNKLIDINLFIEEEGLTLEQMQETDNTFHCFESTHPDFSFKAFKYSGMTYIFTKHNDDLDFSNLNHYSKEFDYNALSWLLTSFQSVDSFIYLGHEVYQTDINNNCIKIYAEKGQRYLLKNNDNEIVCGLHINKQNIIENIYTNPKYRQQGYARQLITQVKKDNPEIKHSDNKTEVGIKMAQKIKL